jgi:hypothetical protein
MESHTSNDGALYITDSLVHYRARAQSLFISNIIHVIKHTE